MGTKVAVLQIDSKNVQVILNIVTVQIVESGKGFLRIVPDGSGSFFQQDLCFICRCSRNVIADSDDSILYFFKKSVSKTCIFSDTLNV